MDKYRKIRNILICFCVLMIIALIVVCFLVLFCGVSRKVLQLVNSFANVSFIGVVFYAIWYKQKVKKNIGPCYEIYGKVISKRKETDYLKNPLGIPEDGNCYITFQKEDGSMQEFCTTVNFYMILKPNQQGVLTYVITDNKFRLVNFRG